MMTGQAVTSRITCFWRAHTVTVLLLITSVLFYISLYDVPGDTNYNIRRGTLAVVIIFILIGVIHMPDGPFIRPHPAVWKFALVLLIIYVLLLIFTLFQTADDVRQFLKYYDSDLGVPLPEKLYAEDCRLYTPGSSDGMFANFMDKMDIFVIGHFFGWYAKALIIRDVWYLTVISVAFELLEYTLECQLPNFGECWWDHWILDFLVCNGLGIYLGLLTCKYFATRKYQWKELWEIPSLKGKLKRIVCQFTPYNLEQYRWGYTSSFRRFIVTSALTCFVRLSLILFNHSLNFIRQLMFGFNGTCAMNEIYHWLGSKNPTFNGIGHFSWILLFAIVLETLIVVKFGWDIITIPIPRTTVIGWSLFFAAVSVWAFWKFTYPMKEWPIIGCFFTTEKKKE